MNIQAEGGANPSIENIGNIQINQVDVVPYDIPDNPDAGDFWIRSAWFYTDPDSAAESCDSTNAAPGSLVHSVQVNTALSPINYGTNALPRPSDPLYICLDEVISPDAVSGSYTTAGVGGIIWELIAS